MDLFKLITKYKNVVHILLVDLIQSNVFNEDQMLS
jgi:hypothetical protein